MYQIGELQFDIINIDTQMFSALNNFKIISGTPEIIYEVIYVSNYNDFNTKNIVFFGKHLIVQKIENYYRFNYLINNKRCAIVDEIEKHYKIYLLKDNSKMFSTSNIFPQILSLERPLINKNTFGLHSSYIAYKNQAILFTAPSGTGKSTQAELWKYYKKAQIINGDRNFVGFNDSWKVYGAPFSGSSEYCDNKTNQLNAIIILEKGTINQIKRIDIKGFNRILSEVGINSWDTEYCNKIMNLIQKLCNEVPIYLYSCTKEENAVNFLYYTLKKDGVLIG